MTASEFEKLALKALPRDLKAKHIPRFVYKYRSVDSALTFLSNSSMYFSSPDQFNDPFEGKYILRNGFCFQRENLLAAREIANTGILCFGWKPDNILMWSHYSDKHRGVCLEFDINNDMNFFAGSVAVVYSWDYPVFEKQQSCIRCLGQKMKKWQHEREIRTLKMGFKGLRTVRKKALTKVIFGCRTSDDDINRIIAACNKGGFHPKFLKYSQSETDFKLIPEPLNP